MKKADRLSEGEAPEPVAAPEIEPPANKPPASRKAPARTPAPIWPPPPLADVPTDLGRVAAKQREVRLDEARAVVNDPKTTTESFRQWLEGLGYQPPHQMGGKARPLKQHLRELRVSAALAAQFRQLLRQSECGRFTDVLLARFEQALMQQMFQLGEDGKPIELKTTELKEIAKLLEQAVDSRKQWESLRRELEAEQPSRPRMTHRDVANRVRQILGIPPDTEPYDEDAEEAAGERARAEREMAEPA